MFRNPDFREAFFNTIQSYLSLQNQAYIHPVPGYLSFILDLKTTVRDLHVNEVPLHTAIEKLKAKLDQYRSKFSENNVFSFMDRFISTFSKSLPNQDFSNVKDKKKTSRRRYGFYPAATDASIPLSDLYYDVPLVEDSEESENNNNNENQNRLNQSIMILNQFKEEIEEEISKQKQKAHGKSFASNHQSPVESSNNTNPTDSVKITPSLINQQPFKPTLSEKESLLNDLNVQMKNPKTEVVDGKEVKAWRYWLNSVAIGGNLIARFTNYECLNWSDFYPNGLNKLKSESSVLNECASAILAIEIFLLECQKDWSQWLADFSGLTYTLETKKEGFRILQEMIVDLYDKEGHLKNLGLAVFSPESPLQKYLPALTSNKSRAADFFNFVMKFSLIQSHQDYLALNTNNVNDKVQPPM